MLSSELEWRKSSRSGASNCIEMAIAEQAVLVRDSKDKAGPALSFSRTVWETFVHGIRSGQLGRTD